jgi:hypothetical protein
MKWETLCRRTNEPKLSYIEGLLTKKGIPHKRDGESFHAPILKVPFEMYQKAWDVLSMDIPGKGELDEIPDDDPMFQ